MGVGRRGLCSGLSLTVPHYWLTAGRLLPVPARRSATRHRPTPIQDHLFLLPAARRGRSRPGRLESEPATAAGLRAWSLSRLGARRESASGSKVRNILRVFFCFFFVFSRLDRLTGTLARAVKSEIEAPRKSSWK